jgi:hypothetical protein
MTTQQKLVKTWSLAEHGSVKSKTGKKYTQQKIDYALKNPDYRNEHLMLDIISHIKKLAKDYNNEVCKMYKQINSI